MNILHVVAISTALSVTHPCSAQELPSWGTVDEIMGYSRSNSPHTPFKMGEPLPQELSAEGIRYANVMWCRDIQIDFVKKIDDAMGRLLNDSVEFNPNGRFNYTAVSNFLMQIRLWNSQQVQKEWEAITGSRFVDYRKCQETASKQLKKFEGAVEIFTSKYGKLSEETERIISMRPMWPETSDKGRHYNNPPPYINRYEIFTEDTIAFQNQSPLLPACIPFMMPGYTKGSSKDIYGNRMFYDMHIDGRSAPGTNFEVAAMTCKSSNRWAIAVSESYQSILMKSGGFQDIPNCIYVFGSAQNWRDSHWHGYACRAEGYESNKYFIQAWKVIRGQASGPVR